MFPFLWLLFKPISPFHDPSYNYVIQLSPSYRFAIWFHHMKEGPYEQLPSSLRDSNRSNSYILNAQSRQTKRILKYLKHFRAFLVHRNLPKKKSYIGAHHCYHCYNHKSSKYDKSNMFKSLQKTNRVTYSFIRCPKNPKNVKNITKINLQISLRHVVSCT